MKLHDGGRAPNPRRVRIFLAEKSVPLPEIVAVDLGAMAHRADSFMALNPWQQTPVLELDDGTCLSETMAICRYVEGLHPAPALFGSGVRGQAEVEMWQRRAELGLFFTVTQAFRHLHPGMAAHEVPQVAAWGEVNRARALDQMRLFEAAMSDGRPFIAGADFTVADITAGIALDFCKPARIPLPEDCPHLSAWHARMTARPSWAA